jgi:hypothetical protein
MSVASDEYLKTHQYSKMKRKTDLHISVHANEGMNDAKINCDE